MTGFLTEDQLRSHALAVQAAEDKAAELFRANAILEGEKRELESRLAQAIEERDGYKRIGEYTVGRLVEAETNLAAVNALSRHGLERAKAHHVEELENAITAWANQLAGGIKPPAPVTEGGAQVAGAANAGET